MVGNTLQLDLERYHLDLEGWAREYGPQYQLRIGRNPAVVISDAAQVRELLKRRPKQIRRQSRMQAVTAELGLDGLFTAEGPRWRKQRKLMNVAFAPRQVRALEPKLIEVTERLRQHWLDAAARGEAIDVHSDLRRYTVDVTMIVAFGEDVDTLRRDEAGEFRAKFEAMFPTFHRRLRALWPYWRVFKLPRDRQIEAQALALRAELARRIEATRVRLAAEPEAEATNLLEAMVLARDEDDPKLRLDDEEIMSNASTIILAGEDTTSNTAAWILDALARFPEVAGRLRAEADATFGQAELTPDLASLARMPYLQGTIHEALRMRSTAPLLFLEALEDQHLGELELPKGSMIMALTRVPAMASQHFDAPDQFDPSRWIEDTRDPESAHDPKALLTFGYGPRICPGRALAMLELGLIGSMVARNFELEAVDEVAPDEVFGFTVSPRQMRLRLRART